MEKEDRMEIVKGFIEAFVNCKGGWDKDHVGRLLAEVYMVLHEIK